VAIQKIRWPGPRILGPYSNARTSVIVEQLVVQAILNPNDRAAKLLVQFPAFGEWTGEEL